MLEDPSAKCMMLSVLPAEKLARFLSSPGMIVLFIAVSAFQTKDK